MAVCLATSVTEPKGSPAGEGDVFRQLTEQGADFLLTVKANQRTLHRQISEQFLYGDFQGRCHSLAATQAALIKGSARIGSGSSVGLLIHTSSG
jgi:hypothetical protein